MTHRRRRPTPSAAFAPQRLEGRCMLSGDVVTAAGLPLLHSLPGAPAAAFLDFDGYDPLYSPFDTDGDGSTFSASEQDVIRRAWHDVASYFSIFDLDVTTEQPASVPYSYSVVSNGVEHGLNVGRFPSAEPTNLNSAAEARFRPAALAHEIGHSFGLDHQSEFDRRGVKVREYALGYDDLHGTIMGSDTARHVARWFVGHPSSSPAALQDDVSLIAAALSPYTGGDGFRADDFGDDIGSATPLGPGATMGVVERLTDADAFSFVVAAGDGAVRLDAVTAAPSTLDVKLEVYGGRGELIAAADGAANDQHLTLLGLAPGTYYAVVKSHGDYGDLGPYELSVRQVEVPPLPHEPTPGPLPPPANVAAAPDAGTTLAVSWDAVAGASGYQVERSDDGAAWEPALATGRDVTAALDLDLAGGHRYFYRVSAIEASGASRPSAPVQAVTLPAVPGDLDYSIWGAAVVLNWRESSGETGYRIERLTFGPDGSPGPWVLLGQAGANVPSFTDRTARPDTRYRYRVYATSAGGDSAPAEVGVNHPPVEVPGLRATASTYSSVSLSWHPITGGARYAVERSSDGVTFARVANVGQTAWTDTAVSPLSRYVYRVVGTNDLGQTATSDAVEASTGPRPLPDDTVPGGKFLPAGWQAVEIGVGPSGAAVPAPGVAGYTPGDGSFTVIGRGRGTGDANGLPATSDVLRFVAREVSGDFTFTARVASHQASPPGAVAGIMVRDTTSVSAPFVFYGVTASSSTVRLRTTLGGYTRNMGAAGPSRPTRAWLRLSRTGNTFNVFVVAAGNAWAPAGSYPVPMGTAVQVGFAAASGNATELSSATFDGVQVSAPGTPMIDVVPTSSPAASTTRLVTLSVRGVDDRPESLLTYTWSVLSRPPGDAPQLSANGTNDAKNMHVTFNEPGHYVFRVDVADGQGHTVSAVTERDVVASLVAVAIVVPPAPLRLGEPYQFAARFVDQFGRPIETAVPPVVRWSAPGGGMTVTGLFTPRTVGPTIVMAGLSSPTASATVFVYNPDGSPTVLSAVSRKLQGRAGPVDLPLVLNGGPDSVEPRAGGPTLLRFVLSADVFPADGLLNGNEFTIRNATFVSATVEGPLLTLAITGVRDRDLIAVTLAGLVDGSGRGLVGDRDVAVRAVFGDVNRDGDVTAADVAALRSRLGGLSRAASDLLGDLDFDGIVGPLDLALVRRAAVRRVINSPTPAPA